MNFLISHNTGVARNWFRVILLTIVYLTFNQFSLEAQDTEYEKWKNSFKADFSSYSDSLNKAFNQFLTKAWIEIGIEPPVSSFEQPKPVAPPSLVPEDTKKEPTQPERPPIELPPSVPTTSTLTNSIELPYLGQNWQLSLLKQLNSTTNKTALSESDIASFWKTAESEVQSTSITYLKDEMATNQLSDWASYQLVRLWLEAHTHLNAADRKLYSWYIMQQIGFDVRLGLSASQIVLLLAFDEPLYDITYYTLDGRKYYQLEADGTSTSVGRIKTYDGIAGRPFYWVEEQVPNMGAQTEIITISFEYEAESYRFELPVNQYRIAYLNQLPRSRPELYEQIQPSATLINALDRQLKPILSGKTDLQKAQFLLTLTQLGFNYKTDEQQFGKEKFMSPEETIWYPFSDCEDRSALYGFLLNRYTQVDYTFVRYPSHIAIALKESTLGDKADSVKQRDGYAQDGSFYIMADPTYMGALIGMEMPKLRSKGKLIIP